MRTLLSPWTHFSQKQGNLSEMLPMYISLTMTVSVHKYFTARVSFCSLGLTVNFLELEYTINEMDRFLTIGMIIGETQRPFTLKLIPTTVEDALNDTVIDYSGDFYVSFPETASGDFYVPFPEKAFATSGEDDFNYTGLCQDDNNFIGFPFRGWSLIF